MSKPVCSLHHSPCGEQREAWCDECPLLLDAASAPPAAPDVDGVINLLRGAAEASTAHAPTATRCTLQWIAADALQRLAAQRQADAVEIARLKACVEAADAMREALLRIVQWADAYPEDVFPAVTKEEWKRANSVLDAAGLSLTRISASNMRHVVEGVGKIARMAAPLDAALAAGEKGE